ncbi:MAG: sensor histidine kinase [Sarcina sp.]
MNKKKEKKFKNVKSIAIKINARQVNNMFWSFLVLNILGLIIVGVLWCAVAEKSFYGSVVENANRSLSIYPFETAKYTVIWQNGKTMVKSATQFIYTVGYGMIGVLIIEGLLLLDQMLFGTRKVRKSLKPLEEMTQMAEKLSNLAFDEEKFQNIEDAISKISPTESNQRLNIGDNELQGLENAINTLLDRMRESYRQQARFVSDASHELRTPISVIQGYANMLDRWGKKDEAVLDESIAAIKSESESMKVLVEQLLFLARGINGKTEVIKEEFSLNKMINEVFEESKMIDDTHVYEFIDNEDILILGDRKLLKQTARILVENAIKYTEKNGRVIFKVGKTENNENYFVIEDNGIGIDEKDVPHIFERFFRADSARVRKDGGTGLGLSIAKWIVDSHNGYFGVLSRKGIGTRITVFLK